MMHRKILITGGAGFIGSWACKHFAASGCAVVNLDKLTYAANPATLRSLEQHPRYRFVPGDIADTKLVSALLRDNEIDAVLNLAAESHVDRSISAPSDFIQTNIVGTFNLLRAVMDYFDDLSESARWNFRFLHVSTDEVYGSLGADGFFTEETPSNPRSPYAASKAASDHLVSAFFHTYGLPVIISNCGNNYGPYQFPEKLIPLVILNAIEHKQLPVYGQGTNVRDWLYVEDHVRALEMLLVSGVAGQCYNIGGRSERKNIDVVREICRLLTEKNVISPPEGFEHLIAFVSDRPGHDLRYAIDCSKIERQLGWQPSRSFESGLSDTIDWYLANKDWWEPIRKHVYHGQRLGVARQRLLAESM
jgi:dTDP-glucose 4,6-dehydratase